MIRATLSLCACAALAACQQYATPQQQRAIPLASQSITLPGETVTLPARAEIVTINCAACHSAEMILTQPRLMPDQWQAEIAKMRGVYKATIDPRDDAKIVAALRDLQSAPQP